MDFLGWPCPALCAQVPWDFLVPTPQQSGGKAATRPPLQLCLGGVRAHPHCSASSWAQLLRQGFSRQYNTNQRDLNVRQAWEQGYTGKGIVVSILDDGIEKNHPDLEGNYVSVGRCRRAVCHRNLSRAASVWCSPAAVWRRVCCACCGGTWRKAMEVGLEPPPQLSPASGLWSTGAALGQWDLVGKVDGLLTARFVFQDPGASFDVNDQDPDPQPRYTQMNDNR